MNLEEFLDKYNIDINPTEIEKIKDFEVKKIKINNWKMKMEIIKSESKYKDTEIGEEFDKINKNERAELTEYYKNKGDNRNAM